VVSRSTGTSGSSRSIERRVEFAGSGRTTGGCDQTNPTRSVHFHLLFLSFRFWICFSSESRRVDLPSSVHFRSRLRATRRPPRTQEDIRPNAAIGCGSGSEIKTKKAPKKRVRQDLV
jgi:hypothetical protein